MAPPDAALARAIAADVLGTGIRSASRFPTGLHHFVYEVVPEHGPPVVLRIATRENREHLAGALFWSERLAPLRIPLAPILHADLEMARFRFPFLVLARLPGTDLGDVYAQLDAPQRGALATQMADLQRRAASLAPGLGYGYALDDSGRGLARTWSDVLRGSLRRTARWLEAAATAEPLRIEPLRIEPVWIERVRATLSRSEAAISATPPTPFFHDITTKNVIVHEGVLSGIVDVDSMAFGDPLFTVALTRMSLLARGLDTDYVDAWCAAMGMPRTRAPLLDAYTALHGLGFLAELGLSFNREAPAAVDPGHRERLLSILASLT